MPKLSYEQEMEVNHIIARDFIEEKLGIEATPENVSLFVSYILSYEQAVNKDQSYEKLLVLSAQFLKRMAHALQEKLANKNPSLTVCENL
ncbi:MAG: hypothetical protein K5Q00_07150 [Gammaproteobacteria bacterium]|nr:hypothetical protein [Gammaproteobacteria bacterium]